jgi:oxygen-independent coproporphyrinogen-3 oxidase
MTTDKILDVIKDKLFYGSADYTKSQPDLFLPHRFRWIAPSEAARFLEDVRQSLTEKEILIYVHLPFCFSECLFCNSFPHKMDNALQQDYLQSLLREIDLSSDAGLFAGKKARCVSLGGGTPTSFSNDDIRRILRKITSCVPLSERCSITCEAHPATLSSRSRIQELAEIGINRISIGCQTFDSDVLKRCNRFHTEAHVRAIIGLAREAGVATNIDMMTGLPGQTLESVKRDLDLLAEIRPDAIEYIRHEIVNPLVIALYRDHPDLVVEDDTLFEMVYLTQDWMEHHGYEQNGRFSREDQWEYRYHWLEEMPILAFGLRTRSYTKTICFDKHEDLSTYFLSIKKGIPPAVRYIALTKREQMYRSFLLNLQFRAGLDTRRFQRRFEEDPRDVFAPLIAVLGEYGCVNVEENSIHLSQYGSYFVEDVCDYIVDAALKEESDSLVRAPHSTGRTSGRL